MPKAKPKTRRAAKPKPKPRPPKPKTRPSITKKKRVVKKPPQKRVPPLPVPGDEQELSGDDAVGPTAQLGGRDAIHVELGEKLASARGDELQERAAIAAAIEQFMQLAIAEGLPPTASAYEALCPEFFWEGDRNNPPVYARVPDATHDEVGRWFQLIVEGVRAYDARVAALPRA